MFHVVDHAQVVYSGELSQATQYVIEHYGKKLDEAIRSGIKILHTDSPHDLDAVRNSLLGSDWRNDRGGLHGEE